eukprot:5293017-Pyramimonas_sp.AAC.1
MATTRTTSPSCRSQAESGDYHQPVWEEAQLAAPVLHHVWYHLLAKAGSNAAGEERPIGPLPFPMRLWGKIAKQTKNIALSQGDPT